MTKPLLATAFLLSILIPATVYPASFDCKKAKTEVEQMICADAELSKLDSDLGLAYRNTMKGLNTEQRDPLRREQQAWLHSRDTCKDRSCVAGMYWLRFSTLTSWTHAVPENLKGEYRWIASAFYLSEEEIKMCQGLEKNINSMGPLNGPQVCERPLNPKFEDFSKPEWTLLEPRRHIDLIRKMDIEINHPAGRPGASFDEVVWQKNLNFRLDRMGIALAKVDLNKDGLPENVIKYDRSWPCDPASEARKGFPANGIRYLVTDDKFSEVMELGPWAWGGELILHEGVAYFSKVHQEKIIDKRNISYKCVFRTIVTAISGRT